MPHHLVLSASTTGVRRSLSSAAMCDAHLRDVLTRACDSWVLHKQPFCTQAGSGSMKLQAVAALRLQWQHEAAGSGSTQAGSGSMKLQAARLKMYI